MLSLSRARRLKVIIKSHYNFGTIRLASSSLLRSAPFAHPRGISRLGGALSGISDNSAPDSTPFRLSPLFVAEWRGVAPPFGFNGLGEFVFATRYARLLPNGGSECWVDTVERVVNGTYNMQKRWIQSSALGWDAEAAQTSAKGMFERIFKMKFLPPGRGLWAMGSPMTEDRKLYAALNNCAFVSTSGIGEGDATEPFCFLMDAAMLGVGVGFDTAGAGKISVMGPGAPSRSLHVISDSREGWVDSLRILLNAHFQGTPRPVFDYSRIRLQGQPIKGFGGTASGPDVLKRLHTDVEYSLSPLAGKLLTVTAICDVMNQIGRCVVSGDVRQTAEIAFGDPNSEEYVRLKDYARNPARAAWGWTSNNSVLAPLGQEYDALAKQVATNGEPGFAWLENMRAYGRMGDVPNYKDARAMGGNPCLEQTLESYELCCLVETFPAAHDDFEDFAETLRYAFLYAKTVTLGPTHWPKTNRVMLRNRRVGTSISGVAQFVAREGLHGLRDWCERGYQVVQAADADVSEWLAIPKSVKTTCVKPSGTVSLLAGATPGMHFPESRFYLRRVRLGKDHALLAAIKDAGFHVEPATEDPGRKVVVTFPVDVGEGVRTLDTISMWEQFSLAAFLQRHWADNQVSCTITFDPEREGPQIARALDVFQYQLKGVSLLPRSPLLAYPQLPYEAISEERYRAAAAVLKPLVFTAQAALDAAVATAEVGSPDSFCESDACSPSSLDSK